MIFAYKSFKDSKVTESIQPRGRYIFSYRDTGSKDWGVLLFVMALGGYRVFYAANWIYKKGTAGLAAPQRYH